MKQLALFLLLVSLTGVTLAQPPAPAISQVFVYFCTPGFLSCPVGIDPTLAPLQLSDGNLYTATFWGGQGNPNFGGTIARSSLSGQGLVIHTFASVAGRFLGGENPSVALLQGADGNMYGVTQNGGLNAFGVMYKLARNGNFQILHHFCSLQNCLDQAAPIIQGTDGNFYGVVNTAFFRITPLGVWSQIGTLPQTVLNNTRLLQGSDGNFYGAGDTLAFKLTPAGEFTLLHQFSYPVFPTSPLIQASDGNLYGATGASGPGTGIFRLSTTGDFAFIHTMTENEGFGPVQLLQATDGNLWGLSGYRDGSYFTITLDGVSIQSAPFHCSTTGCQPSGMIEASDGNFYGTATTGGLLPGENPLGTIFKIAAHLPH